MALGVLLGLGVAVTYAASLGGLLPVLKVLVEQENLHAWILSRASGASPMQAGLLHWVAEFFPDDPSPDGRMRTLITLVTGLVAVNLFGNVLRVFSQYFVVYASHRTIMDVRRKLYRKALHAPMTELSHDVSGRVSQFMTDVREVLLGITTLFGKVAREPLKAICVLALALWMDARLTLVVLAIAPVAVGLLWYFGRKIRKATIRLLRGYAHMLGGLEEALQGLDVVKGYASEGFERKRMWHIERGMFKHQMRLSWIEAITSPLIEVIGVLAASIGIVWLASRTFSGEIEPTQFMTTVVLLTAMLDPIRKVANVYNKVQRAGSAAGRIFEFLDGDEERSPKTVRALPGNAPYEIAFHDLSFRYSPDQTPPALDHVSLVTTPGECVAIVGPNGSGKSTLMKTLPRLIVPDRGRVTIDGVDAAELSLKRLRLTITIVSQRSAIFARTIHENIAYGMEHATLEQVRQAAGRAHAAEFIEQLPHQYETVIGEFGASLSGGQRQRIALARAFLKPASILIFDEATSEIDAESEHLIHDALAELRQGKTTFLIAHRHTVMDLADRIVVMEAGRIVDTGTHAELVERCPLYVALYRAPAP